VAINPIAGDLTGAGNVFVEAVKVYDGITSIHGTGTTTGTTLVTSTINTDNTNFLGNTGTTNASSIAATLLAGNSANPTPRILAGVEIRNNSTTTALDVNVQTAATPTAQQRGWDLSTFRYGSSTAANREAGVLTLRSKAGVTISDHIGDGFTVGTSTQDMRYWAFGASATGRSQWSYRIVAGADTSGANPLATSSAAATNGNVTLAARTGVTTSTSNNGGTSNGAMVRTGTGSIAVAAAGNIAFNSTDAVIYSAGAGSILPVDQTFSPPQFSVGQISNFNVGFPTRGGDVSLSAGGSIRGFGTGGTSAPSTQLINDWLYRQGTLDASGNYAMTNTTDIGWFILYPEFRQGVGTLGGGNVRVTAGGNIEGLSVSAPTTARLSVPASGYTPSAPDPSRLSVNGGGNIDVTAGGDIKGGMFFVAKGKGWLTAGGKLTDNSPPTTLLTAGDNAKALNPILALSDGTFSVRSGGDATIETVLNPTLIGQATNNKSPTERTSYFMTYTPGAAVSLQSVSGDVAFSNNTTVIDNVNSSSTQGVTSSDKEGVNIYPGTLKAQALQGDLTVKNRFRMAPAADGDLELLAANAVTINGTINVWDINAAKLPSVTSPASSLSTATGGVLAGLDGFNGSIAHSDTLLHVNDADPVRIVARSGDITGVGSGTSSLSVLGYFPKPVMMQAGRDIRDAWVVAQNLRTADVSRLDAGRDLVFATLRDASGNPSSGNSGRIELGGPGRLEVSAGRSVDLGNSAGIVTRGNLRNPFLAETGASVQVVAGTAATLDTAAFLNDYVKSASLPSGINYKSDLTAFVRNELKNNAFTDEQALSAFSSLARERQVVFARQVFASEFQRYYLATDGVRLGENFRPQLTAYMRTLKANPGLSENDAVTQFLALDPVAADRSRFVYDVLFAELKATGRAASGGGGSYDRGYTGIVNAGLGGPLQRSGDLNLYYSQIKTETGGGIDLVVPGGLVNAGLASVSGLSKTASELGIVSVSGGSVRAMVRDDFQVNQSRVFTLGGGDIMLWSSEGNIDAGKGSKTSAAAPPPKLVVDKQGNVKLDVTNSVAGSGIGVLLGRAGIAPGDVDLIAPKGEVNAGDAGIRSAGNLNIAAVRVVGADNIQVGGASTGVPAAPASVGISGTSGLSNSAAESSRATDQALRSFAGPQAAAFRESILSVEVIGLGE
jgi:hypothetical protein